MGEETRHIPADQDVFTLKEVAKLLQVSTWTLHQWRKHGAFQAYKPGKRDWRIRREEVLRLLGTSEAQESQRPSVSRLDPYLTETRLRLVESLRMVEFLKARLLQMAMDGHGNEDIQEVMEGFTTRELREYSEVLERLFRLTTAVLSLRHDG